MKNEKTVITIERIIHTYIGKKYVVQSSIEKDIESEGDKINLSSFIDRSSNTSAMIVKIIVNLRLLVLQVAKIIAAFIPFIL